MVSLNKNLDKKLSDREAEILSTVIDLYTPNGAPVGSKALLENAQNTNIGKLSSATIRSVMASLEKKGYLESTHTSSGRQPTENGFKYYVNSLVTISNDEKALKKQIKDTISSKKSFDEIIKDVSSLLSELTGCAGMVQAPRFEKDELEHIDFIRLEKNKVLAVLVSSSGRIENRIIYVPNDISEEVLNKSAEQLKAVIEGQTVNVAKDDLIAQLNAQRLEVDSLMNQMMLAAETFGEALNNDSALVVAGSTNLFQYPELVRTKLKSLIKTFEEKRLLMALLDEVQKGEGVQIFIGDECPLKDINDYSLITSSYKDSKHTALGTLGVIGPIRMNYKKTIQLVDYTAKLLSELLEENLKTKGSI